MKDCFVVPPSAGLLAMTQDKMKTIKFYTLGCKVNQYDTQSIRERFLNKGFKEISNGKKADFYLINTCTVTSVADRKSREIIRSCIKTNPRAKVLVTGCVVEKDVVSLLPIKGISSIIAKRFFPDGITDFSGHTRAFLKIQDGCDNFCSYCKVPLVRGRSRSRPLKQIVHEARKLSAQGFKEIVLTGICLGAYGRDFNRVIASPAGAKQSCKKIASVASLPRNDITLVDLVKELEKIDGIARIRLSSIEAKDVSLELIRTMAKSDKLCRHLHIPIQSGDDEILKKMNRSYNSKYYLALIKKIKKIIPEIAITTDVLVGFPGESEDNFNNTLKLVKQIMPLRVHIFPYSKRENTAAANFKDEISPVVVRQRAARLKKMAVSCSLVFRKKFLHKKIAVLIEGQVKERPDFWEGYSDNYIKVLIKSNQNLKNRLITLRIKKIEENYLWGDFC